MCKTEVHKPASRWPNYDRIRNEVAQLKKDLTLAQDRNLDSECKRLLGKLMMRQSQLRFWSYVIHNL